MTTMSEPTRFQILDTSMVVVLNQPLTIIANPASLFQTEDFEVLLRPVVTYSQGLVLDAARGALANHQYESMASQKTITLNAFRLEVHDKSGKDNFSTSDLPQLVDKVISVLGVTETQAIGMNYELQVKVPGNAAHVIADKLLADITNDTSQDIRVQGGAARYYLIDGSGATYTVHVEPRFNDLTTRNVWMSCNCTVTTDEVPDAQRFSSILSNGYNVLHTLAQSLFA